MEVSKRAQSSSNLLSVNTPLIPTNSAPLRAAQSTNNLSSSRNLSWSPIRSNAAPKVSSVPWARGSTDGGPSRRNSSIDGSVAKAKMVWEKSSTPDGAAKIHTSKKGSVSFRTPAAKVDHDLLPASTPGGGGGGCTKVQDSSTAVTESPVMRNKQRMARPDGGGTPSKRCGFVANDSDDYLQNRGDGPSHRLQSAPQNSVQSGGGQSRRGPREGGLMERESSAPLTVFNDVSPRVPDERNLQQSQPPERQNYMQSFPEHVTPHRSTQSHDQDIRKAQSLPGHYHRHVNPGQPQTSFREAFAKSRSPTPTRNNDFMTPSGIHAARNARGYPLKGHQGFEQPPLRLLLGQTINQSVSVPLNQTAAVKKTPRPQEPLPPSAFANQNVQNDAITKSSDNKKNSNQKSTSPDRKNKKSLFGIFRKPRQKKTDAVSSNSDGEEIVRTKTNKDVRDVREFSTPQTHRRHEVNSSIAASNRPHAASQQNLNTMPQQHMIKCSLPGQPLGIPLLCPPNGELIKRTVSASHDSILPQGFPGQHAFNSNGGMTHLNKQYSSTDNVARREKRIALKSRVQNLRTKYGESSSEEDKRSHSSQSTIDSANSLSRNGSLTKRSRAARTERYLRRKSYELETLKRETQKDKRSREAVQARILEIQRIQQYENERQRVNQKISENLSTVPEYKPKWTANLVYQESTSEVDPVVLATPRGAPYHTRTTNYSKLTPMPYYIQTSAMSLDSAGSQTIRSPEILSSLNSSMNSFNSNGYMGTTMPEPSLPSLRELRNNRSLSYDCNINKNGLPTPDVNKLQVTPPPPPPRDKSRLISPADPQRPFSYSFENLYHGPQTNLKSQPNADTKPLTVSQGIRAILSQQNRTRQVPVRASSELQLSPVNDSFQRPPIVPPLPVTNLASESSELTVNNLPTQVNRLQMPPSPSSDYSSYVSDNSARLTQVNDAWKQKELNLKKNGAATSSNLNDSIISDSSRSSTPKTDRSGNCPQDHKHMTRNKIRLSNLQTDSMSSLSCPSEIGSGHVNASGPEPPKRLVKKSTLTSLEKAKLEMQMILEQERNLLQTKAEKQKQFQEAYLREKRKLEKTRCANFEEALHELEQIYKSLKFEDDVNQNDFQDISMKDSASSVSLADIKPIAQPKSSVPDVTKDDMNNRRYQQRSKDNDKCKSIHVTGSYLAMPQAQVATSDTELNHVKVLNHGKDPDIVYDDASVRNIKRANSIKVIDPQPPFGIPLGPTTQASPNDYLHLKVTPGKSFSLPRKEADPAMDDLAYRNLRRDQHGSPIPEVRNFNGTIRHMRSQSVDRSKCFYNDYNYLPSNDDNKCNKGHTPRHVKNIDEAKRGGKGNEVEAGTFRSNRYTPSWLEQANLTDVDITGSLSSTRAISQPDIRNAIIKEAKDPTGGPEEWKDGNPFRAFLNSINTISTEDLAAPKLVKIQALNNCNPDNGLVVKKLYKPIDGAYNSKPKPFYKSSVDTNTPAAPSCVNAEPKSQDSVNINQLETLISSLALTPEEPKLPAPTYTRVYPPSPARDAEHARKSIVPLDSKSSNDRLEVTPNQTTITSTNTTDNLSAYQKYEVKSAKHNIMNAIRLSMAMGSSNSEGNKVSRRSCAPDISHLSSSEHVKPELLSSVASSFPLSSSTKVTSLDIQNTNDHDACTQSSHSFNVDTLNTNTSNKVISSGEHQLNSLKCEVAFPGTDQRNLPIAAQAATCTNKVKSMIVQSESVIRRGARAHSLPTINPLPGVARPGSKERDMDATAEPTCNTSKMPPARSLSHNEQFIRAIIQSDLSTDEIVLKTSHVDKLCMLSTDEKYNTRGSLPDRRSSLPVNEISIDACVKELSTGIGILRSTVGWRNEETHNEDLHVPEKFTDNARTNDTRSPTSTVKLDDAEFDEIMKNYEEETENVLTNEVIEDLLKESVNIENTCNNETTEHEGTSEYESVEDDIISDKETEQQSNTHIIEPIPNLDSNIKVLNSSDGHCKDKLFITEDESNLNSKDATDSNDSEVEMITGRIERPETDNTESESVDENDPSDVQDQCTGDPDIVRRTEHVEPDPTSPSLEQEDDGAERRASATALDSNGPAEDSPENVQPRKVSYEGSNTVPSTPKKTDAQQSRNLQNRRFVQGLKNAINESKTGQKQQSTLKTKELTAKRRVTPPKDTCKQKCVASTPQVQQSGLKKPKSNTSVRASAKYSSSSSTATTKTSTTSYESRKSPLRSTKSPPKSQKESLTSERLKKSADKSTSLNTDVRKSPFRSIATSKDAPSTLNKKKNITSLQSAVKASNIRTTSRISPPATTTSYKSAAADSTSSRTECHQRTTVSSCKVVKSSVCLAVAANKSSGQGERSSEGVREGDAVLHIDEEPLSSPSLVRRQQRCTSPRHEYINSSLSSDSSLDRMVSGGANGGGSSDVGDKEKRERIQRYKEERRKQIAARYGASEWSSGDDGEGGSDSQGTTVESYRAYRRRRKHNREASSSQRSSCDRAAGDAVNNNSLGAALTSRDKPRESASSDGKHKHTALKLNLSDQSSTVKVEELLSPAAVTDQTPPPVTSPSSSKDKTHKRMSHLNRAGTSEEPVGDEPSQPLDTTADDSSRRRRRRPPQVTSPTSLSRSPSLPLKTPDVVRSVSNRYHGPTSPPPVYTAQSVHSSPFIPPKLPQSSPSSSSRNLSKPSSPSSGGHTRRSMSPITHAAILSSSPKKTSPTAARATGGSSSSPSSAPSTLDWRRKQQSSGLQSPRMVGSAAKDSSDGAVRRNSFKKGSGNDASETCFLASKREKEATVAKGKVPEEEFPRKWWEGKSSSVSLREGKSPTEAAEGLIDECETYLVNTPSGKSKFGHHRRSNTLPSSYSNRQSSVGNASSSDTFPQQPQSSVLVQQTVRRQKNGGGGSEGMGKENEQLVQQPKEVRNRVNFGDVDVRSDDEEYFDPVADPSGSPDHMIAVEQQREVLAIAGELIVGRALSQRSLDGDYRSSPEPQSILKRRNSRDDLPIDRPMTPEPQGILKRKSSSRGSSSRASSVDTLNGDLVPILKKKSSTEDIDHFEPKPILKKKSSTDDELDDRPKSILKSARSGEDLHCDSGVVSPTPILKRSGRCDSEGEELKPILKRRDTTDGVRLRIHLSDGEEMLGRLRSDSAPDTAYSSSIAGASSSYPQSTDSSPSRCASLQRPSILKKRCSPGPDQSYGDACNDSDDRPMSPSLFALRRESLERRCSPDMLESTARGGARPKARTSSFSNRSMSSENRPHRRSSWTSMDRNWTGSVKGTTDSPASPPALPSTPPQDRAFSSSSSSSEDEQDRLVEARNLDAVASDAAMFLAMTNSSQAVPPSPSSVAQKAAYFAQLEQLSKCAATRDTTAPPSLARHGSLKSSSAAAINKTSEDNSFDECTSSPPPCSSVGERVALWSHRLQQQESPTGGSSRGLKRATRHQTQPVTLQELLCARSTRPSYTSILKKEGSRDNIDSPRSILKGSALTEPVSPVTPPPSQHTPPSAQDTTALPSVRKRSILKVSTDGGGSSMEGSSPPGGVYSPPSPPSTIVPPAAQHRLFLKGVLKKDSSQDDGGGKEIKSILKPQSEFMRHSSDSSSDDQAMIRRLSNAGQLTDRTLPALSKQMTAPLTGAEDLGAALRKIESMAREQRDAAASSQSVNNDAVANDAVANDAVMTDDSSSSADDDARSASPQSCKASALSAPEASQILSESPLFRQKLPPSSSSSTDRVKQHISVPTEPGSSTPLLSRLAALQKNGEEGWRQRVQKDHQQDSAVVLRSKGGGGGSKERPVSLLERVNQLESASLSWKGRVTQSDASHFTVAHKLATSAGVPSSPPPSSNGSSASDRSLLRTPQPKVFKSKTGTNIPEGVKPSYRRTSSQPHHATADSDDDDEPKTVEVFEVADDNFKKFFAGGSSDAPADSEAVLELHDLDHISSTAAQPLRVVRRKVQRVARHRVSGNPLKTAAMVEQSTYTQVRLHAGERELKRNKIQEISKNCSFAMEALAGLASKENFSAVTLKPVTNEDVRELPPYTHPMLVRVKGRRHAEARLMEPVAASINSGDDFLLVTPEKVYHFKGEYANVIERAKASEIAAYIVQQKDLGVNATAPVVEITENIKGIRRTKFWEVLGGSVDTQCCGPEAGGDDETMETCLARTNKVYRVEGASLIPYEEAWGKPPTVNMLSDEQVLVFDFGSEVYSWSGKKAAPSERRAALELAKELWESSYDYSDCDLNPVIALPHNTSLSGSRPSWGVLGKVTQNLETVLFKEKFIDWPDTAQQAKLKEVKQEMQRRVEGVSTLEPVSGHELLSSEPAAPDLELEMSHLGRGTEYYDAEERRQLIINTREFKVWHTSEAGNTLLPDTERCHLHASDTYVLRWYYRVTATGRTLKGAPSKHAVTGRDRVAYFFWQGRHSSLSDKGACALMTVELDEERGPHVRVSMGSEPPAFLNIFEGKLAVHRGKRDGTVPSCPWRMYLVRGEAVTEGHLVEVEVSRDHLRSRGCVVLVNMESGVAHLWIGCKTLKHTRQVASRAAQHLVASRSEAMPWSSSVIPRVKEQYEGTESKDFWEGIRVGDKEWCDDKTYTHLSLLSHSQISYDWTPRVWCLQAKYDCFTATELLCSYRLPAIPNPMPFLQEDIYGAPQPALFLVDAGGDVFLWQGWWPLDDTDSSDPATDEVTVAATTGSAALRFTFARKAALRTTLNYATSLRDACKSKPRLILAGFEPKEFTNLFPMWTARPDVADIQSKGGRYSSHSCVFHCEEVLTALSRSHYSLEELQVQPPPDGVDPSRLEDYLTDQDFQNTLGTTREQFTQLQPWKQLHLKKKAKLF